MRELAARPAAELQIVVTGMHLLRKFGRTIDHIRDDGFEIDATVRMQRGRACVLDQSAGLARGVDGLARAFERLDSDIVVVLGDRIEALAGALAATTTRRFLAHIHGGDVAVGDADDSIRHAITKLAHVHFAATADAAKRIVRLGERRDRVFNVGAPGLDELRAIIDASPRARSATGERRALIVQHPVGRPAAAECRTMRNVLRAVADERLAASVIFPMSDPGHTGILAAIVEREAELRVYRSLPRDEYLRHLVAADVLVGNSSSGIIESAFAGTPAVNVGPRQAGRLRGGPSVIDCADTRTAIRNAIRRAIGKHPRAGGRSVYGDGRAGRRIADNLLRVPLADADRRKRITY
jgi:UDP-N-acetylglucosamine 2-epimerase (non-hydrolysing)/GDP/UDP-N,N'-diacetylbacillosamine 2-epimerase (hydrolysing)